MTTPPWCREKVMVYYYTMTIIILRKNDSRFVIINIAVYILLQGKSTGAVVMAEIIIVMECNG